MVHLEAGGVLSCLGTGRGAGRPPSRGAGALRGVPLLLRALQALLVLNGAPFVGVHLQEEPPVRAQEACVRGVLGHSHRDTVGPAEGSEDPYKSALGALCLTRWHGGRAERRGAEGQGARPERRAPGRDGAAA